MSSAATPPQSPLVSVILPVHNAAAYVGAAIESILAQTFTDFELLVVNDGSTDNSADIIAAFKDPRIVYINNENNIGLIATLNKAIRLSRGKYIARMDADDISLPERFAKQVAKMESDPGIAVISGFVEFVNADGTVTGIWNTDRAAVSETGIRSLMMQTNCIAHPAVLMRKETAAQFLYNQKQKGAEDWDLWMRILASGLRIAKLPEVVLQYRIHPASITAKDKATEPLEKRLMRVKRKFLFAQLARLRVNGFVLGVKYSWLKNFARHLVSNKFPEWGRDAKRYLSSAPWKVSAEGKAFREALAHHQGKYFFIFPYTHVGGAEKVHAAIVETVSDQQPLVIFSAFSDNRNFITRFTKNAVVLDVPHYINYPFTRKKAKHLLLEKINSTTRAVLFGSNSGLFYDLVPGVNENAKVIDLVHAFKYQPGANLLQHKLLPLVPRIDQRIFVSEASRREFAAFYFHANIPEKLAARLQLISNAVPVEAGDAVNNHQPLGVLFVGRDSPEKRLPLFLQTAKMLEEQMPGRFKFTVVGTRTASADYPFIHFAGEITDDRKLGEIYAQHDFLLLTSSREGFPVVIMEAMAKGLVVVATPVGDIPNRLNGKNGIVISSAEENKVAEEMAAHLRRLSASPALLAEIKKEAKKNALENFSEEKFRAAYRSVLEADSKSRTK